MEKQLMSGNEAIARGAFEAGVTVGAGYPGTPSTEILENLTAYPGVYTEWSVNEKVAYEVGLGASLAGARTLLTMKHVGLNVAADPLFTSSYIGVKGGLVIACADDPAMHSSQNEQDSRNYALAAKVPMLEPSDSQEAADFTRFAFELSEKYDTPVILRTTTRISHSMTVVQLRQPQRNRKIEGFTRNIKKYVMIPAFARERHQVVEERMQRLGEDVNTLELNIQEINDNAYGIITSGVAYTYVKEALPEASVLKLGLVHPLPLKLVKQFCERVGRVFIVEELDPFIETCLKAAGFKVEGKEHLSLAGEYSVDSIREGILTALGRSPVASRALSSAFLLPPRPPSLCPGCPHKLVFDILSREGVTVTGDIGCYTLGVLPPYNAMDTCVEMGGSIGVAQGIEIAEGENYRFKTAAVIGDSTFAHSGITGLLNAAYNKRRSVILVLDNSTTAMTGMQPNPLSGERINGEVALQLDYLKLAAAVGIPAENVSLVDSYDKAAIETAISAAFARKQLSLIVVKGLCIILKRRRKRDST